MLSGIKRRLRDFEFFDPLSFYPTEFLRLSRKNTLENCSKSSEVIITVLKDKHQFKLVIKGHKCPRWVTLSERLLNQYLS